MIFKTYHKKLTLLFIFSIFVSFETFGAEYRTFYNGIRGLGMGGAQIAVVNDETALIVNPAALGKLRNFYGTVLDPELEAGQNIFPLYTSKAFNGIFDPVEVVPSLRINPNENYHASAQIFPSFVGKNFGIGFYNRYLLDARVDTTGNNLDHLYYRNDVAFVLGYNLRFFDGRVKFGFNAKLNSRIESSLTNVDLSANPDLNISTIGQEGMGLSLDGGLILAAPWSMIPTLAITVHDFGSTSYTQSRGVRPVSNSLDAPATVNQDLDAALALFPIHNSALRSTWTIEYKGLLTSSSETDSSKRIHAGYELNVKDLFFLRMGYNQRYITGGFELASEHFQFQVATYGEEIGTLESNKEDRRYAFKFAFRF